MSCVPRNARAKRAAVDHVGRELLQPRAKLAAAPRPSKEAPPREVAVLIAISSAYVKR